MKARKLAALVVLFTITLILVLLANQKKTPDHDRGTGTWGFLEPASATPADTAALAALEDDFTFLIASDLGRNGFYYQKPVAEMMDEVASITDAELVAVAGDVHHFMGVSSVRDPLWLTNFEWVYSHPELMIPWRPVLGNHEYRGDTRAVLDCGAVSRRWEMPNRYYSMVIDISSTGTTEPLARTIQFPGNPALSIRSQVSSGGSVGGSGTAVVVYHPAQDRCCVAVASNAAGKVAVPGATRWTTATSTSPGPFNWSGVDSTTVFQPSTTVMELPVSPPT